MCVVKMAARSPDLHTSRRQPQALLTDAASHTQSLPFRPRCPEGPRLCGCRGRPSSGACHVGGQLAARHRAFLSLPRQLLRACPAPACVPSTCPAPACVPSKRTGLAPSQTVHSSPNLRRWLGFVESLQLQRCIILMVHSPAVGVSPAGGAAGTAPLPPATEMSRQLPGHFRLLSSVRFWPHGELRPP
jgi:hypothetical protein